MEDHQKMMLDLYGAEYCKIKTHLAHHIPDAMDRTKVVLDCFSNERRNSTYKKIMGNVSKEHPERSLLNRLVFDLVECAKNNERISETEILAPTVDAPQLTAFIHTLGDQADSAAASRRVRTRVGTVCAGDLVLVGTSSGQRLVCKVVMAAARVHFVRGTTKDCYIIANLFACRNGLWVDSAEVRIFPAQSVLASITYMETQAGILADLPTVA